MRGATTLSGAVLLAALAAARAASLSPIQTKEAGLLATIKGFVADKQRLDSNAERVITNAKARIEQSGPASALVGLNKTDGAGTDAGVSVSVVSDAAQAMLVGGVPAGNLLCFYDDAGFVVGLQQGNVTVCSATGKYVTVNMALGYVSGLKVARSGAGIGWLEFEVTTPGTPFPAKYPCGTAPAGKAQSIIPAGHAMVSFDATCAGSGVGRRKRSLLDAQAGAMSSLAVVAAPVTDSKPMPGGQLAVKRVQPTCDGKVTYQVMSASDTSVTICAPITPPCDLATSYASVLPNATTDRVCAPLSECDPGHTYQVVPPTATSDRVCRPVSPACVAGVTWESQAPTALYDRVCSPVSPLCQAGVTWERRAPTALTDRVCARVTQCDGVATFLSKPATNMTDAVCSPVAPVCDMAVAYEATSPNITTNRECAPLSPPCDGVYTWESVRPTARSDRRCSNITAPCDGVTTFQIIAPSSLRDRQCGPVSRNCTAGVTYQSAAPTPVSDRVCSPITVCDGAKTWQSQAATALTDTVCTPISPPCDGYFSYQTQNATATSDRVCSATTFCDGVTTYESVAPTPYTNRQCAAVTPCPPGTFQIARATPTHNTACKPVTVCDGVTTFQVGAATNVTDTVCAPVTKCNNQTSYQSTPPTNVTDAACSLLTVCGPGQAESVPPTYTSDRVCGYANGTVQCNFNGNYGYNSSNVPADVGYRTAVCLNQQTAPDMYIAGVETAGTNVDYTYPQSSTAPTLVDLLPDGVPDREPFSLARITVANRAGATWNVTVYKLPGTGNNSGIVVAGSQSNNSDSAYFPLSAPPFPPLSNATSNTSYLPIVGGLILRGQAVDPTNDPSAKQGMVEIFGPACDTSNQSVVEVVTTGPATSPSGDPLSPSLGDTPVGFTGASASFTGYAVNCRTVQQTVQYQATVTSQRTFSYAYANTQSRETSDQYTFTEGVELKQGFDGFFSKTEVKVSASVARQQMTKIGTSSTQTSTETSTETLAIGLSVADAVPALSNCTASGTLRTSIVSWKVPVQIKLVDGCGSVIYRNDTLNMDFSGLLTANSSSTVTFNGCTPPDVAKCRAPPIATPPGVTCETNVQCAAAGFSGACCPRPDGVYLACCAQAAAHQPACGPSTYQNINDAICPSQTNVYASCCQAPTNATVFSISA